MATAPPVAYIRDADASVSIPNSLWSSPPLIAPDALVILFESHQSLSYCYATPGQVYHNRHGSFHHDDMIGQRFGARITARHGVGKPKPKPKNGRASSDTSDATVRHGYLLLLAPTPELWARALHHRTQIVFTLDASAVLLHCALRSGHRVVESGTGSGALTSAFARAVAPAGRVFTFEFNAHRARVATEEFARNGLAQVVAVECRDACAEGFPSALDGTIDVVFLDLPCPWKAVEHASRALKPGGRLASYSPCIEQVQKTCDALRDGGYELIRTIETRLVPYSARHVELPVPDFGKAKTTGAEATSAAAVTSEATAAPSSKKRRINGRTVGDHLVARKDQDIRGHTAFLTFATKFFA